MFKKRKSGKILAAVILGVFLLTLLYNPILDKAWAFDPENFTVSSITIGKTYDRDRNLVNTYILIQGTYLEDAEVGVLTDAAGYQPLTNRTTNSFGILQFTISEDMKISSLVIGTGQIAIGEGQDMPSLTGVDRKVKLNEDLHIQGTNLSKLENMDGNNLEVKINNTEIIQSKITVASNERAGITMDSGQTGMQEIVITHQETSNLMVQGSIRSNAAINLKYTYQDQFLLVQDLDVSSDLEMFPNRGEKGDTVFFRATKLDEYDVFFLKALDGTDPYSNSNRGKNTVFKSDAEGEMDILSVQVPDINTGEYYVVLTNKIAAGQDPMDSVMSEWVVGKDTPELFTVIDAKNKAKIFNIQPAQGPDSGSPATISGQFLGSINISDLTIYENVTDKTLISANGESLIREITPATGEIKLGYYKNTIEIKQISREITAIIGNKAVFRDGWSFTRELDRISVNIPQVTDAANDPKKDVVLETTTVLTDSNGKLYTFKERAELKDGYTFIPSMIAPEISGVTPDIIEVIKSGGNYRLPEPRIVALHGKNFTVHRFEKEGQIITRYPLIRLGEIELNKNVSPDLEVFVLDKDGNILDGSTDNEIGTKIIALIPEDKTISSTSLGKTFVEVVNPVRNSEEMGLSHLAPDMVEFVVVPDSKQPVIEKVSPDVVSIDGGEEIVITGSNFAGEVKVFLNGEEISSIHRQEDGKRLTFTAPPGREGETQLQVMNPEGGMDTWPFTYVTTYTNPRIIDFAPRQGNTGTLVMVTGENFLKPEPTANEDTILRLIGTRVLLEGIEVNDYNRNTATKKLELQDYSPAPGTVNEVLRVADGQLQLADYYNALLYEDEQGRFYALDVNSRGDIILSNGAGTEYTIKPGTDPDTIVASKSGGGSYPLTVRDAASLQIEDTPLLNLQARTVYKTENGIITGCRVKVLGIDTLYFTVPLLEADGYYDVTVVNPDTKQDSKKDQEGFLYYSQPQSKPVITNIEPAEGSTQGGYTVEITGSEFEDNGVSKTRVYVNGAEVPPQDTIINTLGNNIKIKIPPYPGDLREDKGTDRLAVPVVVVNPDGGSDSCEEGFTYVVPKSHPSISKIVPSKGSAAGGDIVEITGSDFRYYEPYDDANRNQIWDPDESFNDLNKNGSWDTIEQLENQPDEISLPLEHPQYSFFYNSPILPKIYFGENLGRIVEFERGYIKVISPPGAAGNTNVYLVNNDSGISNAVNFTYESSAPQINSIVPDQGRKQGRESAEITGSGFFNTSVKIWRDDQLISQQMPVVRFGDIDNQEIPREQPNSGLINNGRASVELPGGLKVEYNAMGAKANLTIKIEENDVLYAASFDEYDDSIRFIDIGSLLSSDGITRYPGFELIKVSVKERCLLVERGYSPEAELLRSTQISVKTPSYYTIGKVSVTVSNPDGGTAVTEFEYKNPDSNPKIVNITRDGLNPKEMNVDGRDLRVLQMNYQGNSLVTVLGEDFRENAHIMIGDLFTVEAEDINYTLPNKLSFTMPDIDENQIGKLHRVVVINEDGGVAASDELPAGQKSIYLQFTKGETVPAGEKVEPLQGPTAGGTVVKITGKDFRASMEGYEGKSIAVYFGGKKAEKIKLADYKTIYALTPANIPGKQLIKIENPDGETAEISEGFTYISNPQIAAVVAASDSTETARVREVSIEGGQEIKIKGSGFMEGVKAVFAPEVKQAEAGDNGEQIYRQTSISREFDGQSISSQELDPYILKSGIEAPEVKFIDSETITVKVPAGKIDTQGLMVINPDRGASETYDGIKYGLPGLDTPLNVTAEIMHDKYNDTDRFIKVAWNPVQGAIEYEVYVYIDGQIKFIGSTDLTTYVYTDLKERTTYRFKVTAVGNFGSSKPSAESNKVKTGREVGAPDEDGSLDEKTTMKRQGDKAIVSIGTAELNKDVLVIDLTRGALAGSKDLVVSIPASVITAYAAPDIEVKGSDFGIKFNPRVFKNKRVYNNSQDNAGVRFSAIHSRDNPKAPGGNNLSEVLDLKAEFFTGQSAEAFDYLSGNMSLLLDYDAAKVQMRRINNIQLSRYDEYSNVWLPIGKNYYVGGSTSCSLNRMGLYTVMGSRR